MLDLGSGTAPSASRRPVGPASAAGFPLVTASLVDLHLRAPTMEQAVHRLGERLAAAGRCHDLDLLVADVLARERLGSTAFGDGVVLPHARSAAVTAAAVVVGRADGGVEVGEQGPATLVLLLAVPVEGNQHLEVLATLARRLVRPGLCQALHRAVDVPTVLALLGPELTGPELTGPAPA